VCLLNIKLFNNKKNNNLIFKYNFKNYKIFLKVIYNINIIFFKNIYKFKNKKLLNLIINLNKLIEIYLNNKTNIKI